MPWPKGVSGLVEIWRSAVQATHDFLDEADFRRIESNLPSLYFPNVTLIVADVDGTPVGFAGVAEGNLEMLFVSNTLREKGIGSALLHKAITDLGVAKVDVNEQNASALRFYLNQGFSQVARSELDSDGRPYPLLQLEMRN